MLPTLVILLFIAGIVALCIFMVLKNLLCICQPNEVLIFSGSRSTGKDGKKYQIIKGGRRIRKPIIERVDRLDLTNMVIDLAIRNAYSKGGIPLIIDAVANIKIAGSKPVIHNAIERLLGKSRRELVQLAKDTLEGNLRGVLAAMTPEELNEDKTIFQNKLVQEADKDLERIGLKLDTLNIQNIADEVGYLDSIGRKQSAEIQKKASIAEARARAESLVRDAKNHQVIELAKIQAELLKVKAAAERRIIDATTRRGAVVTEQKTQVSAELVKATAEIAVQTARIEQVRRKLQADVIEPANANMQAAFSDAIGKSAKIIENGNATAEALRAVTQTWKNAGDNARDIFLMQKVEVLVQQVMETVHDLKIDQITVLPASSTNQSNDLVPKMVSTSEQIKAALGVDLPEIIKKIANPALSAQE